ncbi:MAG TPA: glycosyltransferase family 2 protein [Puia sp.]|nr:glycosyltransferase family 2 protein [Puia sp.]
MSDRVEQAAARAPWVSFCMSTYRRPELLRLQLERIRQQTMPDFVVVVSDNDPEGSARSVVQSCNDPRILYFHNSTNLGMVKSFNKSLERSGTEFVVMITDDDPVYPSLLAEMRRLIDDYPGYGIYCGCLRPQAGEGKVETFDKDNFVYQLLHPGLTRTILWSSCVLRRDSALAAGGMADYGSPHLADHALLALCGREKGGVMINRMYSEFSSHAANFSKANFESYYVGCREFYALMTRSFPGNALAKGSGNVVVRHLEKWFISMSFNLRRFYTYGRKDREDFRKAVAAMEKILDLPFMRGIYLKYQAKRIVFYLKFPFIRMGLFKNDGL